MKRVYLLKVNQNGHERYLGSADARTLVRMANKTEFKEVQEAQRPLDDHRLEELSRFVLNDGTLSTSMVIGTVDDRIKVQPVLDSDKNGILYYTEFPETEDEFEQMEDTFDVMDGQHRLFSFMPKFIKITDDIRYDLSFEMYVRPTLKERRLIFTNTNEHQKPVSGNLLMWFRDKLGLLSDKEKEYYSLVNLLATDSSSPLNGRIILSQERIPGGIKAQQLIKLFGSVQLKDAVNMAEESDDTLLKAVSVYLRGWEQAVGSKFKDRDKTLGAFSKIAGLRYIFGLLRTFYEIAVRDRESFSEDYIKRMATELYANLDTPTKPRDFFDMNSDYNKKMVVNPFVSDYSTNELVENHRNILRNLGPNSFNPFG